MKKNLLLFACASLFMVGTTFAQTKSTETSGSSVKSSTETSTMGNTAPNASTNTSKDSAEDRAKKDTEKMASELNMTADQKQKALQTNLKYYRALDEMKHNKTEDSNQEAAQAHKDQLNSQRRDEFHTFLSDEQMTKMENKVTHDKGDKSANKGDKSAKPVKTTDKASDE